MADPPTNGANQPAGAPDPPSESSAASFIEGFDVVIDGLTLVASIAIPAIWANIAPGILGTDTDFWSIFLATLAWSLAIAIVTYLWICDFLTTLPRLVGAVAGAFLASNFVASLIGATTMVVDPTMVSRIPQVNSVPEALAAGAVVLFVSGLATFGFGGLIVGSLTGIVAGWRASEIHRHSFD